ncbi:hypothetical protein FOQG_02644 [Fusarium oxysporum f. sp. raphani 54005]|uniref:Uncharacterized protein n=2 Tax=Fusarium oxysporum TaxID=5507 RepID=X0DT68_FUSOX|nr:hypothetical protein FOWG_05936 [Fusarium oxysporum f. sp. lycopersici MN25]EXK97452.1 hypothetical protein FOQG_02644 [Fusarium oxysporum f. sp. raphani 54005]EXL53299.1 hypothetical protein FOCG_06639 [Fusarium oxysporum f. sp. radicis-lycopersici 26381]EXM25905.1 hypothetical protein FOTG_07615 [Fusarium oxysporum f. sp. vasinfectum 25433]
MSKRPRGFLAPWGKGPNDSTSQPPKKDQQITLTTQMMPT